MLGFFNAFGFHPNITFSVTKNTFQLCAILTGKKCTSIDIDMLNTPHGIEHDGSFTRNDAQQILWPNADNHSFNQTVWDESKQIIGSNTHYNTQLANTLRLRRVELSKARDVPGWFIEAPSTSLSEHAFILMALNDPQKGRKYFPNPLARVDWMDYWFVKERLPTALGWRKPTQVLMPSAFSTMLRVIKRQPTIPAPATASPTPAPVTADAFEPSTTASPTEGADPPAATQHSTSTDMPATTTALEKRAEPSIEALPSIVASPRGASAVRAAAAYATQAAGAQPFVMPNTYVDELSEGVFVSLRQSMRAFVTNRQQLFLQKLGELLRAKA